MLKKVEDAWRKKAENKKSAFYLSPQMLRLQLRRLKTASVGAAHNKEFSKYRFFFVPINPLTDHQYLE